MRSIVPNPEILNIRRDVAHASLVKRKRSQSLARVFVAALLIAVGGCSVGEIRQYSDRDEQTRTYELMTKDHPLLYAAVTGNLAEIEHLVQTSEAANADDQDGLSALHWAQRLREQKALVF